MTDPFQNVDAAGPEFIKVFADSMDVRQADPAMETIVATYLGMVSFAPDSLTIEVGSGAGAVTKRIAAAAHPGAVIGYDPSSGFVNEARARTGGIDNVAFEVASGTDLPQGDQTVDNLVMHTVLTHVTDPDLLLAEAHRVLKPGGALVICDGDFSKATFSNFPNDPLDVCAREFVDHFVTDPYIVAKLRALVTRAGLDVIHFDLANRITTSREGMLPWVEMTTRQMVARGDIGAPLGAALVAEYEQRAEAGTLYGFQTMATLIAHKPR